MSRTTTILFTKGDYAERMSALEKRLEQLSEDDTSSSARRQGSGGEFAAVQSEWEALRAEAEQGGTRLTLRGLNDFETEEFEEAHPARPGEDQDTTLGFNAKTGRRELVRLCAVEPSFSTEADFKRWALENELTRGDVEKAVTRAWLLTYGQQPDPKLLTDLPRRGVGATSD